jgi:PIN domain nuclease of toxin-antitoxin system
MKFLLDTSIFLRSLDPFYQLNKRAQEVFTEGEELYLSSASSWEIIVKYGTGKLNLPKTPISLIPETLTRYSIRTLPITLIHTFAVQELPNHHKDPFDRILIAQARCESMVLMTEDLEVSRYPVEVLWCGK